MRTKEEHIKANEELLRKQGKMRINQDERWSKVR